MLSPLCEKAVNEALGYGKALLKFISPNDVGITGSHQCGFYLPKSAWEMFTPHAPQKGANKKHEIEIEWNGQLKTDSVITWYGSGTRSEYRLTSFGRGFPWLINDTVGDLLVLIPKTPVNFLAYVLDLDDDIEEILAALNLSPFDNWAVYDGSSAITGDMDDCLRHAFNQFAKKYNDFPSGEIFSDSARNIFNLCHKNEISKLSVDSLLLEYYQTEYKLFQTLERQICQKDIVRLFNDVDDFLKTAATIMNRRKSRAGRSLENHVDYLLSSRGVPHEMRPDGVDGKPDIIIPDSRAYSQQAYPIDQLFMVGVKTTCKDRWRQVLNEAKKIPNKHILTLQPGISENQLIEMHKAKVTLVVPDELQKEYPKSSPIELISLESFIEKVSCVHSI